MLPGGCAGGALLNGGIAVLTLLFGIIAAAQLIPFETLRDVLLFNYAGGADTALAIMILLALINVSFMLVLMVGVLAREMWTFPVLWLLALANGLLLFVLGWVIAIVNAGLLCVWLGVRLIRELSSLRVNPVMIKELRGRMRGVRAFRGDHGLSRFDEWVRLADLSGVCSEYPRQWQRGGGRDRARAVPRHRGH